MRRRMFVLTSLGAGCKAMNFSFDYSYFDGPAQLHTSLSARGTMGTLIRQAGSGPEMPIGVSEGTLSAKTVEALWNEFPAKAPAGPPLMPGMPNHLCAIKRDGVEKTVRLAGNPGVLEQVRPFITALETAMREAGAKPVRTLAVRVRGWAAGGLEVELTAAGREDVAIPDGAAIAVFRAPEQERNSLREAGRGPAGALRLAAGSRLLVTVPVTRQSGMLYEAVYRRQGMTEAGGSEIFGEAASGLAPR